MDGRAFTDKAIRPELENLSTTLGKCFGYYEELLSQTAGFKSSWQYSPSSGWMQKVFDGKKALFYVIPHVGGYVVSLTLREAEREAMLANSALQLFYDKLRKARKFTEGYHLVLEVKVNSDHLQCLQFINALIYLRTNK